MGTRDSALDSMAWTVHAAFAGGPGFAVRFSPQETWNWQIPVASTGQRQMSMYRQATGNSSWSLGRECAIRQFEGRELDPAQRGVSQELQVETAVKHPVKPSRNPRPDVYRYIYTEYSGRNRQFHRDLCAWSTG